VDYEQGSFAIHQGYYHVLFERAEMCATCHDVTNPLTIKNTLGKWVSGFPIERTYTEWANSRYADRPGNVHFDPAFKRDCQTCHMQQDYGQAGTAQTLYTGGEPVPPIADKYWPGGKVHTTYYSHHFIGGNTYITRLLGADVSASGEVVQYPELSSYSFSSASDTSPYHNAYWNTTAGGPRTQHSRLAWDRLRNALTLELSGHTQAEAGTTSPLSIRVTNTGAGHNFPTGFPEGRNAWVALRAFDLATGTELEIFDAVWNRTSRGVGYLTDTDLVDPTFPGCQWLLPAGSPDPYAWQFKAVASLGDGCPTLQLPYATPLNLVVNDQGMPIDTTGQVIDRDHPLGLPQFKDLDGDGDLYDDAFLLDTRLRPMPQAASTVHLERYAVVIPPGTRGPVAVTAAVYYQSFEGMVAKKLLGNLADTDLDFKLEPCVLKGACDGRVASVEPAVVEGAPPVPMEVRNWVIIIQGEADTTPPTMSMLYPTADATDVYEDVVVKITFSEPIQDIDNTRLTLLDANGQQVPAQVAQIGDYTWGLFPNQVFLQWPGRCVTSLTTVRPRTPRGISPSPRRLEGDRVTRACRLATRSWPVQQGIVDFRLPPRPSQVTARLCHGGPSQVPRMPSSRWANSGCPQTLWRRGEGNSATASRCQGGIPSGCRDSAEGLYQVMFLGQLHCFALGMHAELPEDGLDVIAHGGDANAEILGNVMGSFGLCQKMQHLLFSCRQRHA
jgi:hypothetical protein